MNKFDRVISKYTESPLILFNLTIISIYRNYFFLCTYLDLTMRKALHLGRNQT